MRRAGMAGAIVALVSLVFTSCMETTAQGDFRERRLAMVDQQIRARDVAEPRVLEAMRRVPRHRFVPPELAAFAYDDRPLPSGHGQTISQPYIVAYMSELLDVAPQHRVLEVGSGSGYQAAVLATLAREVYTIEIVPALAREAAENLEALGFSNVQVREGDGYAGWPERAPFDRIMVTAAPQQIPQPLVDQLAAGGRLVIPIGEPHDTQWMTVVEKTANGVVQRKTIPVAFVPFTRKQR